MFIYRCDNAHDLIGKCERLALTTGSGTWLFRGQGDSAWTLVPSLLLPDARVARPQDFEAAVLDGMRRMLRDRTTLPEALLEKDMVVLGLAQHYDVPTRLLDWTRDPDVALYFAASDALRKPPQSGAISVFALARIYLDVGEKEASFLFPPRAANPNLAAQRGVLVRHEWTTPDLWDAARALPTSDPVENVSALIDTRLVRLDLDVKHADDALELLAARGVDASVVFPSEHGIARFAEDMARLDVVIAAKIRDPRTLYVPTR